jgi:central kinetochore subunit Mis15/CHL4
MAPRSILAPSTSALPDTLLTPSTSSSLPKLLSKLSRQSILNVALEWLRPQNQRACSPFLEANLDDEAEETAYAPAEDLEELRTTYEELRNRKGSKGEVVDRIIEGDWRHGISLRQLAMLDMQHLLEHPASQKWTALKLAHITAGDDEPMKKRQKTEHDPIPELRTSTFLRNLQNQISPLVKAHYHVHRPAESLQLPMTILRIYITDTPYRNPRVSKATNVAFTESSKTIYVAFPDSCPYVFISLNSSALSASKPAVPSPLNVRVLKKLVLDAIPKALSSRHNRYKLETTSLSAKSLTSLLNLRGNGKTNDAQGTFSIFANGTIEESPLDPAAVAPGCHQDDQKENSHPLREESKNPYPTPENTQPPNSQLPASQKFLKRRASVPSSVSEADNVKRRKAFASTRFGTSALDPVDGTGLDRFEIRLEETVPSMSTTDSASSLLHTSHVASSRRRTSLLDAYSPLPVPLAEDRDRPAIRLTFSGTHVFAGIRALVENGVVDGERMPRWLTGEEGVSVGVVRAGRMLGRR